MGDRISISFKYGDKESIAVFSHWDGLPFLESARLFANALVLDSIKEGQTYPLYRLVPEFVVLNFIRYACIPRNGETLVKSNYYLGKDRDDGDNSDNGHHTIDLKAIEQTYKDVLFGLNSPKGEIK